MIGMLVVLLYTAQNKMQALEAQQQQHTKTQQV